jgi:hypothetical protein
VTRPSHRAGWIATIGAVAALVALFFLSCEKRSIEIPSGYQGEAARNPYLAAQRLLERMGTPVRSFAELPGIHELPPPDATLLVPTPRRTLGKARALELTRWVESGGNLVVVSWQLFDDGTPPFSCSIPRRAPVPERGAGGRAADEEPPPWSLRRSSRGRRHEEDATPAPRSRRQIPGPRRVAGGVHPVPDRAGSAATSAGLESPTNGAHFVTLEGAGLVTGSPTTISLAGDQTGTRGLVYRIAHRQRPDPWIVWGDEYRALTLSASPGWS